MLSGKRLQQKIVPYAARLQAAANIHRLSILYILTEEPKNLREIIRRVQVSPALAAHHLGILVRVGWITKSKFGKEVIYTIHEAKNSEVKKLFS